jgi:hypothetical protein
MGDLAKTFTSLVPASPQAGEHAVTHLAESALTAPVDASDDALLASLQAQPGRVGVLLLDASSRPISFALRGGPFGIERRHAICVLDSTDVEQALKRALTRPPADRFDPLACCDELGRNRGVVAIERLVEALIRR